MPLNASAICSKRRCLASRRLRDPLPVPVRSTATLETMSSRPPDLPDSVDESLAKVRPPGTREFTLRAVIVAAAVAAVIGAAYPYVVLKLGFGPNIAVVSAFFGWLALAAMSRGAALRWEANLAQAA